MIKANVEFDNLIASGLSPIEFISKKVFGNNVEFKSWDAKKKIATFDVFCDHDQYRELRIMKIKLKNVRQM